MRGRLGFAVGRLRLLGVAMGSARDSLGLVKGQLRFAIGRFLGAFRGRLGLARGFLGVV